MQADKEKCADSSAVNVVSGHVGQTAEVARSGRTLLRGTKSLVVPWTTVANARELQSGSLEQLKREPCVHSPTSVSTGWRAEFGDRESGPLWNLHAFIKRWLRLGLPARTALSKEDFPILPRTEHTPVVRVPSPETDSLPKMPSRPLEPTSPRFEGPTLLPGTEDAPPLKAHHRGPPLRECLRGTPATDCRVPDRIETPLMVADCEGCGWPWARHTSRRATTRSVHLGQLEFDRETANVTALCLPTTSAQMPCGRRAPPNTTARPPVPMVPKSSGLIAAAFQILVFPKLT